MESTSRPVTWYYLCPKIGTLQSNRPNLNPIKI